jgi:hypothetical protein
MSSIIFFFLKKIGCLELKFEWVVKRGFFFLKFVCWFLISGY